MADVTVKRTEDFEPTFGGGMLKARSGLGVTSFGMQILRFPANADRYPEHDHADDGQEEVYIGARGRGDAARRRRGAPARAGRVRSRRARARRASSRPATSAAMILVLGGVPGKAFEISEVHRGGRAGPDGRSRWPTSPSSDSRTSRRSSAAASCRVRAGLGVSSFGIAVMELPAELRRLPRARPGPRPPGGGLHGARRAGRRSGSATRSIELEPGVWVRVGPGEKRKIVTGDEPARVLAVGGSPGEAYDPPEFTEEGAPDPIGHQARTRAGAGPAQRNRSSLGGALQVAAAPGPSSSVRQRRGAADQDGGGARGLVAGEVGGGGELVGDRDRGRGRARGPGRRRARASRRAATSPAQPIATSA